MSSQSNILINELGEDPSFYENEDIDFDSEDAPLIPVKQITMRLGHDGGPYMIYSMLNLPFYHLKSLCYFGHAHRLNSFLESYNMQIKHREENDTFDDLFRLLLPSYGNMFGGGIEYIAQILSLSYGTQIFTLGDKGDDLWGRDSKPCHIITTNGENSRLEIDFEISKDTTYTIAQDPIFFKELSESIEKYNQEVITPEFQQYYIKPLERGFSIQYNIVLALTILRYKEQILGEMQKGRGRDTFSGFILNEVDSIFKD